MIFKDKLTLPYASLGAANPLPDIMNNSYIHASIKVTDKITAEESRDIGRGMIGTMLPYLTQDGYSREKLLRDVEIVVLENENLRAEFIPSLGARLWRLYDKVGKRELLYVNPVFQPCNLALRNAWFSGGVEFNVGIKGHNPLTCSPLFAEKRTDEKGDEYVSFYEYERIRGVVYSVNAYLPDGATALTIRCVIENTSDDEKFMYWWSNIAVDETPGMRVLVPAEETFVNYFGDDAYVLDKASVPNAFDTDISYPARFPRSIDYFYKIPREHRKWIAAANEDGKGLLHFSDMRLLGRKLFLWGKSSGGRHWGEYLSEPGSSYVEIQAGLAHTQLEHFEMPAKSKLEWVECYAPLDCTGEEIHGDYKAAVAAVEAKFDTLAAPSAPELTPVASLKSRELLAVGSDWGRLEALARGERISDYFDFPSAPDSETEAFAALLEDGVFPEKPPLEAPKSYAVGDFWIEKLEKSLENPNKANHSALNMLGVALYEASCRGVDGASEKAVAAWERSLELCENPWALRNLAAYRANVERDYASALELSRRAALMKPDDRSLAIDCGRIYVAAGAHIEFLELVAALPESIREIGRMRLLRARALLALDRLDEAAEIVNERFEMPDIKEGEVSISALWFELKAKQNGITVDEAKERFTLPYSLDFRMHD